MCGLCPGDTDPATGRKVRLHLGHIKDKNLGGRDELSNLRALCSTCNQGAKNVTGEKPTVVWLLSQVRRAGQDEQAQVLKWLLKKFRRESGVTRSENMAAVRSKDTKPEMIVRRMVHGLGFRYKLHDRTLPGKPDLVFPRLRKIIEVRGCFWHQHEECVRSHQPKSQEQYWRPKLARNRERDERNEAELHALGWAVLVVWECELKDVDAMRKMIARFLSADARSLTVKHLAAGIG